MIKKKHGWEGGRGVKPFYIGKKKRKNEKKRKIPFVGQHNFNFKYHSQKIILQ